MSRLRLYRWLGWRRHIPSIPPSDKSLSSSLRRPWGFGVLLLAVPAGVFLFSRDELCKYAAYVCVVSYGSAAIGVFAAGILARMFSEGRAGLLLVESLILAGASYLLLGPLQTLVWSLWTSLDSLLGRETVLTNISSSFVEIPGRILSSLGGWSSPYLIGISVCAFVFLSFNRRYAAAVSSSVATGRPAMRRRDMFIGIVSIGLGITVAYETYVIVQQEIGQVKAVNSRTPHPAFSETAARLEADLWLLVVQSSVVYLVLGALLLAPPRKSVDSHRTAE